MRLSIIGLRGSNKEWLYCMEGLSDLDDRENE